MNKTDRILVTGSSGFLGTAVIRKLKEHGFYDCIGFGSNLYDLTKYNETEKCLSLWEPKAIIHLAAKVGGIGANKSNPGKFAYDNLIMGTNIIECARVHNIEKMIIAGTICAYPKMTPIPFQEKDLWNGYPEETNAPYGLAKKMLLVLAQGYRQQYGCNFSYLLPVNLYGPNDNFNLETSHVIPAMIRKFHEAKQNGMPHVTLWGDGTPTREFLYVDDCAEAFVMALEKYNDPEPMNIGSGAEISMKDLSAHIKEVVGYSGEIIWDSTRPNGQPRRCLDTTRAKEKIDWVSKTTLQEGLKKTYNWFLDSGATK